ncbi:MAG: purine-nucleoside phosphorylase [Gammaproteobacteria bacterium RIFOXYB2_FULL_38_6]|nr:MAG: purine-nucleoside phosphorylase [Gammaproteobacteria bacterium RIFOXYB2_FULL_38_6]
MLYEKPVKAIQERIGNFKPEMGIVAGSGLGDLADALENKIIVPYAQIPDFVTCSVAGHTGELHFGTLHDVPVVCLKGRLHLYEGISADKIKLLIRTLKLLGCKTLFLTNAAGGINENFEAGDFMVIKDHINFQFQNVLSGPNDEEFGPRFSSMDYAYDAELRKKLFEAAKTLGMKLQEGVYLSVLGPSFETPAEIKAFRIWGADAVGMSTVPEVIIARHCGMRVAAVSIITNKAAGLSKVELSHKETLETSARIAKDLIALVSEFVKNYR